MNSVNYVLNKIVNIPAQVANTVHLPKNRFGAQATTKISQIGKQLQSYANRAASQLAPRMGVMRSIVRSNPLPQPQRLAKRLSRPPFRAKIDEMVGLKKVAPKLADRLVGAAENIRSPFNFYSYVNRRVEDQQLLPATAFYILRAYDKARNLSNYVTDKIASQLRPKSDRDDSAYRVYQTYRIVRKGSQDQQLFQQFLQIAYSHDPKRVKNLLAYQSASVISNSQHNQATETLRKSICKKEFLSPQAKAQPFPYSKKTPIEVHNKTTFAMAEQMVKEGFNPAVLNMANEEEPGGGFITGASAQEEQLCRQSNLYQGLNFVKDTLYPLAPFEVMLAPKTTFFRDDNYNPVAPFQVDVIGSAAYINSGRLPRNRPSSEKGYLEGMKAKMRSMFRMAIWNGNDSLLLSAFGCGAFGNDPKVVSRLYKEVLQEAEFQGQFVKVVFGIIDDHNGKNVRAFEETFS